jgi:fatty aldehyde-generating acyl-ACP reductase
MGGEVAGISSMSLDFALIAHQETWRAAADVLAVLRGTDIAPMPEDDLKEIFPWIPPRAVCHVDIRSTLGHHAHGIYIDCFIPPGRLGLEHLRENLGRVRDAAACAIGAGARVVSLGGFSSILIEGNADLLPNKRGTIFTTGNTLTVAFIVQGIQKMCALQGRAISEATLLIVGATGDVGSGCARCLSPLVKRVVLNARNPDRLRNLAEQLRANGGATVETSTDLQQLSVQADIVLCVASLESPSLLLGRLAPGAIVCDAGYPKNLAPGESTGGSTVFYGGLGQVLGGLTFTPDVHRVLHRHPFRNVAQGCMLEGMVLALEGRFEPFSQGRGFITRDRVEEIAGVAARHGIQLARFYNGEGAIDKTSFNETEEALR